MATYILGDIHGEFDKMVEILRHIGLVEWVEIDCLTDEPRWKKGCMDTLIQVGDMIDGGYKSVASFNLLRNLQEQAEKEGGEVIRLLGNHELAYISPVKCTGMESRTSVILKDIIENDVLDGNLIAAHELDGYLITHGGVTDVKYLGLSDSVIRNNIYLNNILLDSVRYDDYANRIFHVGKSRGGLHKIAGVFWADWDRDILAPFKQIVGHTSVGKIEFRDNHINVDCGFSRHAQQVYEILKYENGNFEVITI